MNGKFAKNVAFDSLVLWPLIYVAASDYAGFGIYAERFISFLGVFLLILGVLVVLVHEEVARRGADKNKRTKTHLAYLAVSSVAEISVFAALGWYWVAAGFMLVAISSAMVRTEIEKLEDA